MKIVILGVIIICSLNCFAMDEENPRNPKIFEIQGQKEIQKRDYNQTNKRDNLEGITRATVLDLINRATEQKSESNRSRSNSDESDGFC